MNHNSLDRQAQKFFAKCPETRGSVPERVDASSVSYRHFPSFSIHRQRVWKASSCQTDGYEDQMNDFYCDAIVFTNIQSLDTILPRNNTFNFI